MKDESSNKTGGGDKMRVSLGQMKNGKITEIAEGKPVEKATMTTKEEYQEIGTTREGERVYRSTKDGYICTEKDNSYLVHSTHRDMEEAGMAVIEESCGGMQVWIPTGGRIMYNDLHGGIRPVKIFRNTRDGHLAVRLNKNRMVLIEEAMTK